MELEKEILAIKERNKRVEGDKAWEKSFLRLFIIVILTYVFAFMFMAIAGLDNAWMAALVPVLGFLISNFTLPPLKKWWLKKFHHEKTNYR